MRRTWSNNGIRLCINEVLLVFLLISVLFLQVFMSVLKKSNTFDEPVYMAAGYTYWTEASFSRQIDYPPLPQLVIAAPLLLLKPRFSIKSKNFWNQNQFTAAKRFLYVDNDNAEQMVRWARIPIMLLSLFLGLFVYKWARQLGGGYAGIFALLLYAFEPNILAHSGLATTDLMVTAFIFIATYRFWKLLRSPTKSNAVLAGITFGLAQASKFSAVILAPAYLIILVVWLTEKGFRARQRPNM